METQHKKSEIQQIKELIELCLKHWYYFVICFVCFLTIGVLYLKIKKPVYLITAQVTLRDDDSLVGSGIKKMSGSGSSMLNLLGMGGGSENIDDVTAVMKSQGHLKEMIEALDLNKFYYQSEYWGLKKTFLYDNSPIILDTDSLMSDTIMQGVNIILKIKEDGSATANIKYGKTKMKNIPIASFPVVINTELGNFMFSPSATFQSYKKPFTLKIDYVSYDYAAQVYSKILTVDYKKKTSNRIALSVDNENIYWGKKLLYAIIDTYNRKWDADKEYGYRQTMDFINTRLNLTKIDLDKSDRSIQEFKDKNNLTDIEADVKYYFTMSGELQTSLLETETQLKTIDIIRDFIGNETNRYNLIPFSLNKSGESLAAIIEKYNEILLKRNEMYKNNVQSVMAQSMDGNLEAQRKNLIQSLDNERKGMQLALDALQKKETEINRKLGNLPMIERDYIDLKREQELQQTIYIFLLEKREETSVRFSALMPKLKIIDAPYVINKPVSPSKLKTVLVILFGSAVIPLFFILGLPYIRKLKNDD